MSLEAFLARLYVDDALRAAFLADPTRVLGEMHLDPALSAELLAIDRVGLELAAESFARKRARTGSGPDRVKFVVPAEIAGCARRLRQIFHAGARRGRDRGAR